MGVFQHSRQHSSSSSRRRRHSSCLAGMSDATAPLPHTHTHTHTHTRAHTPVSMWMVVVLPAPLCPRRAVTCPCCIVKLSLSTAQRRPPLGSANTLVNLLMTTADPGFDCSAEVDPLTAAPDEPAAWYRSGLLLDGGALLVVPAVAGRFERQ
jgi:hypothetical protein